MKRRLAILFVVASFACDTEPRREHARVERTPSAGEVDAGGEVDATADTGTGTADAGDTGTDTSTGTGTDTDTSTSTDTSTDTGTSADTGTDTGTDTGDTTTGPPAGTPDDPITVTAFPFVVAGDSRAAGSDALDRYSCAPADESGPEIVYRFDLLAAGHLVAELEEAGAADVDLHLLDRDPVLAAPDAVACRARANTRLSAELGPGRYWLVVDSYVASDGAQAGAYRLALEYVVADAWQTVPVAPGVLWKQKVYASYAGGKQTINTLDVDLAHPAVSVRPHGGDGCVRPSAVAPAERAVAAINAGFFDTGPGTCPPLDLIKIEGALVSMNRLTGAAQRSFGVDDEGRPLVAWIAANQDWPEAWSAIGAYPSLVTDGAVRIEPDKDTDFFAGRHPRSALGLTASGHLLLVTVDGRGPAGLGMTLAQLAQHLINLGAVDAVNLDGGGSTAMWVRDQSLSGVVNFPSDGDGITHGGERAVSDVLLVFSDP